MRAAALRVAPSVRYGSVRAMSLKKIDVIVTETTPGLGQRGEVIAVQPGHARNHLFPKKLAVYATPANRIAFEEFTSALDLAGREEAQKRAQAVARIETVSVLIRRHAEGPEGRLHTPLVRADLVKHLWRQHFILLREEAVLLDDATGLGTVGAHAVPVLVADGVKAQLRVVVKPR